MKQLVGILRANQLGNPPLLFEQPVMLGAKLVKLIPQVRRRYFGDTFVLAALVPVAADGAFPIASAVGPDGKPLPPGAAADPAVREAVRDFGRRATRDPSQTPTHVSGLHLRPAAGDTAHRRALPPVVGRRPRRTTRTRRERRNPLQL